jgi:DNA invertase Pin-like site-specific DNA recombinase
MHHQSQETAMARKFIPYSRFSGKRQEAGDSQRRQDEMAEKAAREEGLEIDQTICLKDKGMSAFRGKNWRKGNLGKFIDLVDAGVIPKGSILCIERVNRLSRAPWMVQVEQWKEILSRGIIIRTCEPPARYTKKNMDDLAVGCPVVIYMMLGHLESKQKSEWSFEAFDARKKQTRKEGTPHGLRCPKWIDRIQVPHPKDPTRMVTTGYQLNRERAAILSWMHERAQEGWGAYRIQKDLVTRGVVPWGSRGRWTTIAVRHFLTTRQTVGEYQPTRLNDDGKRVLDGPPIAGHYPAAISEECWQRTQDARRGRRGRGGRISETASNLFTHLTFDAKEEKPLHTVWRNDRKRRQYLTIDGQPWVFVYRDFERAVLTTLAQLRASDVDGRHQADALNARVERLQAERSSLDIELETLDRQLNELPPAKWPKRVVTRMSKLEEQIAAKDEELRAAKEAAATSTRTEALVDLRSALSILDEAIANGNGAEEQALRRRIKGRIPFLVESIWVRMQVVTKKSRYVHVRIYLQGGQERYLLLAFAAPKVPPLPLVNADFRGGEERGYCVPATGSKLKTKSLTV